MASMVSNGGFNVHQCGSWRVANFDGRIYFHTNIVVQFGLWCCRVGHVPMLHISNKTYRNGIPIWIIGWSEKLMTWANPMTKKFSKKWRSHLNFSWCPEHLGRVNHLQLSSFDGNKIASNAVLTQIIPQLWINTNTSQTRNYSSIGCRFSMLQVVHSSLPSGCCSKNLGEKQRIWPTSKQPTWQTCVENSSPK